jgi:penicillin-binding protein 1A
MAIVTGAPAPDKQLLAVPLHALLTSRSTAPVQMPASPVAPPSTLVGVKFEGMNPSGPSAGLGTNDPSAGETASDDVASDDPASDDPSADETASDDPSADDGASDEPSGAAAPSGPPTIAASPISGLSTASFSS